MIDSLKSGKPQKNNTLPTTQELESYLFEQILEPWFSVCIDEEYGGFLCDFDRRWHSNGPHEKLLEFQTRQTWIAAEASLAYPDIEYLNDAALHGFRFLMDVMWDSSFGGWFHRVDRSGRPLEEKTKHMHGVAYAIPTCIVVYAATGKREALKAALSGFEWLEKHSHDNEHGGYFGFLDRYGKPIKQVSQNPLKTKSDTIGTPIGCKDANVHTDLLEAFLYLHRTWPNDKLIKERVDELISIVTDRLGNKSGEIQSYCKFDWSYQPGPKGFGFNMQGAHRLLAAIQLFPERNDLVDHAQRFIDYALLHGWDKENGGLFAGILTDITKSINKEKPFWVQMEALWALYLIQNYVGQTNEYNDYLSGVWNYISNFLTDKFHPGVYGSGTDSISLLKKLLLMSPLNVTDGCGIKGGMWKDASHEGRALLRSFHISKNINTEGWDTFPLGLMSEFSSMPDLS